MALAAASVDHTPEDRQQVRHPLDLVQDDQLVDVVGQVQLGLGEASEVSG